MIINIKGTSGSGKSTLVRKIMALYDTKTKVKIEGRKQPIGYICNSQHAKRPLAVIGHYETDCGGCDTINKMDDILSKVLDASKQGYDVLFEGLLISADVNRTLSIHNLGHHIEVIALNTPIEVCLSSINERRLGAWHRRCKKINEENYERETKGNKLKELPPRPEDVNPKNTLSKFKGVKRTMELLQEKGVPKEQLHSLSRDEAYDLIRKLLVV